MTTTKTDFVHIYNPGTTSRTLVLLHGTGGDEKSLLGLGKTLDPAANILSLRGRVVEGGGPYGGGANRFFRRLAEGVFDEADLRVQTHALAEFLRDAATRYQFNLADAFAVGYSNGANIAASTLLLEPAALAGAALLRPMVPLIPAELPNLTGKRILIAAGQHDPMGNTRQIATLADLYRRSHAELTLVTQPDTGHELTQADISTAYDFLKAK